MPEQVKDLDTGRGGGDDRDASEIQIGAAPPPAQDPDLPPESIFVRIVSARDPFWAEAVAGAVYERDDSTKGSTNPKAQAQQQHANHHNSKPKSNSQRYSGSLQPKPPIAGIPGKIQHHSGHLSRSSRRPTEAHIFPKNSRADGAAAGAGGGGRKSAVPDEEPGSPKVSCIGKVLSERERDRRRRNCRRLQEEGKEERTEPAGCWASLTAVLCCAGGGRDRVIGPGDASTETIPSIAPAKLGAERRVSEGTVMEPPALGAMRPLASGRRTALWGGDGDVRLDLETAAWGGRRSVGSREQAEREREADGSASV